MFAIRANVESGGLRDGEAPATVEILINSHWCGQRWRTDCTAATPSMEIAMFDHIGIGVSDLAYSKKFFLDALAPLGVAVVMEFPEAVGLGPPGKPAFWLSPTGSKPTQLHLAFIAESHSKVDEFYRCAIAAGAKDNGAPGLRPEYHANYYAAFVIAPDGHNVEAVCHEPEA